MNELTKKVYDLTDDGKGQEALALVKSQPQETLTDTLSQTYLVYYLARKGGQGQGIVDLVEELQPEAQTAILSAGHAAWALASLGKGQAVIDIIEKLPQSAQAKILATEATAGLVEHGLAQAVLGILEKLPQEAQQKILARPATVWSLVTEGNKESEIERIKKNWTASEEAPHPDEKSIKVKGQSLIF
jgi:hypothetical protein